MFHKEKEIEAKLLTYESFQSRGSLKETLLNR
jgi:hypothetical protein